MYTSPNIDAEVRSSLTRFFAQEPTVSLMAICEQAESQLLASLTAGLLNEIKLIGQNEKVKFLDISQDQFLFDGTAFQLRITEHESKANILQITVLSVEAKRSP